MISSRIDIGKRMSCTEYNRNNSWLYNGNNGNANNNNRMNSYSVRASLEFGYSNDNLEDYYIPLHEWYEIYRQCRKHKRIKPTQLVFEYNFVRSLIPLVHEVNNHEYVPRKAICFIINIPRTREVIAADFADRLVHTLYCRSLMPYLEEHHYHNDSYACRVGKGGLRAVYKFRDYVENECSKNENLCIIGLDMYNFFMSLDMVMLSRMLEDFIDKNIHNTQLSNTLKYLTRILYLSLPQEHCIFKSPKWMWNNLPKRKSLIGKTNYEGTAIGNLHAQMMGLFVSSMIGDMLTSMGYKFVIYTDDIYVAVPCFDRWRDDLKTLEYYCTNTLHVRIHPNKRYVQHWSKGCNILGMRMRYGIITPSKRMVHNLKWMCSCEARKANEHFGYALRNKEGLMSSINSYMGLMKWTSSYTIRKSVFSTLKESKWSEIFNFDNITFSKVSIKNNMTRDMWYRMKNKKRKSKNNTMRMKNTQLNSEGGKND